MNIQFNTTIHPIYEPFKWSCLQEPLYSQFHKNVQVNQSYRGVLFILCLKCVLSPYRVFILIIPEMALLISIRLVVFLRFRFLKVEEEMEYGETSLSCPSIYLSVSS